MADNDDIVWQVICAFKEHFTAPPGPGRQCGDPNWGRLKLEEGLDIINHLNCANYSDIKDIISSKDRFEQFRTRYSNIINNQTITKTVAALCWQISNNDIYGKDKILLTKTEKELLFFPVYSSINKLNFETNQHLICENRNLKIGGTFLFVTTISLIFYILITPRTKIIVKQPS